MSVTCQRAKNQWNVNVTVILSVVGATGMVIKNQGKILKKLEIRERIKINETTELLR